MGTQIFRSVELKSPICKTIFYCSSRNLNILVVENNIGPPVVKHSLLLDTVHIVFTTGRESTGIDF